MPNQTVIKFQVEVGADRVIRLPDEVPVGTAEIIISPPGARNAVPPPEALGLFRDIPELVDQAMAHAAEMRAFKTQLARELWDQRHAIEAEGGGSLDARSVEAEVAARRGGNRDST